jgi:hypothetical protein
MKKQLSVFALAAASVAIGMTGAHAQALPNNQFNPNTANNPTTGTSMNTTGNDAQVITVGGIIPEFIQFTTVDNAIELGNIGGPELNGTAVSVTGRRGNDPAGGTTGFVKNTDSAPGEGDAVIEFKANTFIRVKFAGNDLRNVGPDATANTADDIVLPTFYRVATKGKLTFAQGETVLNPGAPFNAPGTTGQNPTNPGDYASYTGAAATDAENPTDFNLTYSPGGPVNNGYGGTTNDPNLPSGFRVMAEVERHGLNDYWGAYSTTIGVTYYKY